jgi:hypothetical protein
MTTSRIRLLLSGTLTSCKLFCNAFLHKGLGVDLVEKNIWNNSLLSKILNVYLLCSYRDAPPVLQQNILEPWRLTLESWSSPLSHEVSPWSHGAHHGAVKVHSGDMEAHLGAMEAHSRVMELTLDLWRLTLEPWILILES